MDEGSTNQFRILDYIEDNSGLFTVIGVFGALAIYLVRVNSTYEITTKGPGIETGIAACFFIFYVLLFYSLFQLLRDFGWDLLHNFSRFTITRSDAELLIVLVPLTSLSLGIQPVVARFRYQMYPLIFSLLALSGWATIGKFIGLILSWRSNINSNKSVFSDFLKAIEDGELGLFVLLAMIIPQIVLSVVMPGDWIELLFNDFIFDLDYSALFIAGYAVGLLYGGLSAIIAYIIFVPITKYGVEVRKFTITLLFIINIFMIYYYISNSGIITFISILILTIVFILFLSEMIWK